MWPELNNTLSWWQWSLLGLVPPAIVSLYFLKLRRRPLEVPSTYLWRKSIEDLHVNSVWQRLRRSLLLLLQLLVVLLAMLALLRPTWQGTRLVGGRYIFLIDNSASMNAGDGDAKNDADGGAGSKAADKNYSASDTTRLEAAQRRVSQLIDAMQPDDTAMIISFADVAQVQQAYTNNRALLHRRLEAIRITSRTTSLREALVASAGLANPGSSSFEASDAPVAEALPARLFIFSDGKFADVENFALANLYAMTPGAEKNDDTKPVFVPYGAKRTANVGIVSLGVQRSDQRPDQSQAFVRLENFSPVDVTVRLELYVDGALADVKQPAIVAGGGSGAAFDLDLDRGDPIGSVLSAKIADIRGKHGEAFADALSVDNEAWAVVQPPRRGKVMVVTPGNFFLERALGTESVRRIADVTFAKPSVLAETAFQKRAADGALDLVIYDRCVPIVDDDASHPLLKMPQSNTLFIGRLPPLADKWPPAAAVEHPQVIDADASHPLLAWVDMEGVAFAEGIPLSLPKDGGARSLVETTHGTMLAIAARAGYEDAVLSAEIVSEQQGEQYFKTNWWQRQSFPVFLGGALRYLGRGEEGMAGRSVQPGASIDLRSTAPVGEISVKTPKGEEKTLRRGALGAFHFTDTDVPGVYAVVEQGKPVERFAVNLFSASESDIRPRTANEQGEVVIRIGHEEIAGRTVWEAERRESWRFLLALGLVAAVFEWYIYNRRVYL